MKNSLAYTQQPFDSLASSYDKEFTDTDIGKLLRGRTHEQMSRIFKAGDSVLEINCGTGEDAAFLARMGVRVTATDGSKTMIDYSRSKIEQLELDSMVKFQVCDFEELDSVLPQGQKFDGIVSNFGGLNCAYKLEPIAAILAKHINTDGRLFICIMGRWTPWEWIYLGWQGQFRRIWQRMAGVTEWRGITIRYFTPARFINIFEPYFKVLNISGLGFLLPPTYAGAIVTKYPKLFQNLNSIEKCLESLPGIPQFSDHFMMVMTRN
jgi:SAM-dependent methyltransferase